MKLFFPIIGTVFILICTSVSWAMSLDDLVERDGLWYKKFTNIPFSGELSEGSHIGTMKNGKPHGFWVKYWDNGGVHYKGYWKNGVSEGYYIEYHENGQLMIEGSYKNGKKDGCFKAYNQDGSIDKWWTGFFKNGDRVRFTCVLNK